MDPFHLMTSIMNNILIIAQMIVTISIHIKHADCNGRAEGGMKKLGQLQDRFMHTWLIMGSSSSVW